MSEVLRFVFPMPKNIANGAHGHWSSRHREKNRYWDRLDEIQGLRGWAILGGPMYVIPRPPPKPLKKAAIRSTMYLGAAMDDSNAMRRHKWIEDWLKTRGYIKDDRKKCLTWERFPDQVVKRDGNYRILLVLTPEAG